MASRSAFQEVPMSLNLLQSSFRTSAGRVSGWSSTSPKTASATVHRPSPLPARCAARSTRSSTPLGASRLASGCLDRFQVSRRRAHAGPLHSDRRAYPAERRSQALGPRERRSLA